MARPENRSEARALSLTLPIETFNYLVLLATLGKLGALKTKWRRISSFARPMPCTSAVSTKSVFRPRTSSDAGGDTRRAIGPRLFVLRFLRPGFSRAGIVA